MGQGQIIENDVEYMNYGSPSMGHYRGHGCNQGGIWGAGLGGAVVGGVVGYVAGKNSRNNCGHGNYGHDGYCGHNGCNDGCCGDNTHVNRFELKQAELIACKDSQIAELKAEKYADCAADKALREANCYTDKMIAPLYAAVNKLNDKTCCLQERVSIDEEKICCLDKEICHVVKDTNKAFKETWHRIKEEYVHQPRIKVCCSGVEVECAREGCCDDFTPLV